MPDKNGNFKLSIAIPSLPPSMEREEETKKPNSIPDEPEPRNYSTWNQAQHDSFIKAAQSRWAGSE